MADYFCAFLGEAYFKAMENPLLYFQVLMLSAQFEPVSVDDTKDFIFQSCVAEIVV